MKKHVLMSGIAAVTLAGGLTLAGTAVAGPPFGNPEDTAFAAKVWQAIASQHFVGPDTIRTYPYEGTPPHGDVLEFIGGKATIDGREGTVLVKKNYYGDGIDDDVVLEEPDEYLKSITVMFRREAGYDPEDKNWFWAKYTPAGELMKNPKGMQLAGRVAKGADVGCIACHAAAEGDDFVYTEISGLK